MRADAAPRQQDGAKRNPEQPNVAASTPNFGHPMKVSNILTVMADTPPRKMNVVCHDRSLTPTLSRRERGSRDGREAWVAIATMEILYGKAAAREISDVLAWARTNQAMLARKFEKLQQ